MNSWKKDFMKISKSQILTFLFIIIIPIGFYTKFYSGFGHEWVNNKLGGVFYEIFWCWLFFIILPKIAPVKIALWVFIITCALEFTQLLNNSFLEIIRDNFIGQTIFGNSFSWADFPYYIIGSIIGFLVLERVNNIQ